MALLHSASLVVFSSCLEQFGEEEKGSVGLVTF
jgi:hypothetical protein